MTEHPALRLLPRAVEGYDSTKTDAPWRRGHLLAVADYLDGRRGLAEETAILALGEGIQTYIDTMPINWSTGAWEAEQIVEAIDAMGSLLNHNLGRLDPGTLSAWVDELKARVEEC